MFEVLKKLGGDVLANFRYPHLLMADGVTTGITSAVGNLVAVSALLIFSRSFFGIGLTGFADSTSAILVAIAVAFFGGMFAIPFGSNVPAGKNLNVYDRMKKVVLFLIYSFYGTLLVSTGIITIFGLTGHPVVQWLIENLPFEDEWQAVFVLNAVSAVVAIPLLRALARSFSTVQVDITEWNGLSVHKFVWFPFYVLILAVSSTYAMF
jgi:hypothetical protein